MNWPGLSLEKRDNKVVPPSRAESQEASSTQPISETHEQDGQVKRRAFWDTKFSISTLIVALFCVISAYLEYSVWPAIMTNGFGETNVSLHLSFFTYTLDSVRCSTSNSCVPVPGLPSFDFTQLFLAILILMQVYHLRRRR